MCARSHHAQVRWAVLNTVMLLRKHHAAHEALAAAMLKGASVAECLAVVEALLDRTELLTPEPKPAAAEEAVATGAANTDMSLP